MAMAQNTYHESYIDQLGNYNDADVIQVGPIGARNFSDIDQFVDYNDAFVKQFGTKNVSYVDQIGAVGFYFFLPYTNYRMGNDAYVDQLGKRNFSDIVQDRSFFGSSDVEGRNYADVFQKGDQNESYVKQAGVSLWGEEAGDNTAIVWQWGKKNWSKIRQYDNDNYAMHSQTGFKNDAETEQKGTENTANVYQVGNFNDAWQWAQGFESYQNITQFGCYNDATQVQYGYIFGEYGYDNGQDIFQNGRSNWAYQNQRGNGNYASAYQTDFFSGQSNKSTQLQQYDGNSSYVYQYGDYNEARVDQTDNNGWGWHGYNSGDITQLGDINKAFIEQNGLFNVGCIFQDGDANYASLKQIGHYNTTGDSWIPSGISCLDEYLPPIFGALFFNTIVQLGNGNNGTIDVYGDWNETYLWQAGNDNMSATMINGSFNDMGVYQHGNYNSAEINVDGYDNATFIVQTDKDWSFWGFYESDAVGNVADIDIYNDGFGGNDNVAGILQVGDWNDAYINIFGDDNLANIQQKGDVNFAVINQYSDNNIAITNQTGDCNTSTVLQNDGFVYWNMPYTWCPYPTQRPTYDAPTYTPQTCQGCCP
jgi:hypothetical protein